MVVARFSSQKSPFKTVSSFFIIFLLIFSSGCIDLFQPEGNPNPLKEDNIDESNPSSENQESSNPPSDDITPEENSTPENQEDNQENPEDSNSSQDNQEQEPENQGENQEQSNQGNSQQEQDSNPPSGGEDGGSPQNLPSDNPPQEPEPYNPPPNKLPIADFTFTPSNPTILEAVTFDASRSTDPDGSIINWTWKIANYYKFGKIVQFAFQNAGTYTVNLTIVDNRYGSSSIEKEITVSPPPNQPPIIHNISFSYGGFWWIDQWVPYRRNVSFTAVVSDPDGSVVNYTWNFGDGSLSYQQNPTHNYANNGIYTVTLTVKDNEGATATGSTSVNAVFVNKWAVVAHDNGIGESSGNYVYSILPNYFSFPKEQTLIIGNNTELVRKSLRWLVNNTDENATIVISTHSHGGYSPLPDNSVIFIHSAYSDEDMKSDLQGLKSQKVLITIFACQSGGFATEKGPTGEGRIVITSSSKTDLSDTGDYCVFWKEGLVEGRGDKIGNQDGKTSVEESYKYYKGKALTSSEDGSVGGGGSFPQINDQYPGEMFL